MSGGSFNYLYRATTDELLNRLYDLEDMADALAHDGFVDAAKETYGVLYDCRAFEARMEAHTQRLAPVWKAVEWERSGDWGHDQVAVVVNRYRGVEDRPTTFTKRDWRGPSVTDQGGTS